LRKVGARVIKEKCRSGGGRGRNEQQIDVECCVVATRFRSQVEQPFLFVARTAFCFWIHPTYVTSPAEHSVRSLQATAFGWSSSSTHRGSCEPTPPVTATAETAHPPHLAKKLLVEGVCSDDYVEVESKDTQRVTIVIWGRWQEFIRSDHIGRYGG
jgi:hypothetical protein